MLITPFSVDLVVSQKQKGLNGAPSEEKPRPGLLTRPNLCFDPQWKYSGEHFLATVEVVSSALCLGTCGGNEELHSAQLAPGDTPGLFLTGKYIRARILADSDSGPSGPGILDNRGREGEKKKKMRARVGSWNPVWGWQVWFANHCRLSPPEFTRVNNPWCLLQGTCSFGTLPCFRCDWGDPKREHVHNCFQWSWYAA